MIRQGFIMTIKPGAEEEYKRRHDEIWDAMVKVLKDAGVSNYSIFRSEQILFAYVELEDLERWNMLSENQTVREWWDYMADIMDVNADNSPVIRNLDQVFYLA